MKALKIATFNINGIRSRLPALLAWLERETLASLRRIG